MFCCDIIVKFKISGIIRYLLPLVLLSSCSKSDNVDSIMSEAFNLAQEGRYDEAQMKALEAEELLTDNASLESRIVGSALWLSILSTEYS